MTVVERLCAVSSMLPPLAQAELLDFAEFLQQRHRSSQTVVPTPLKALVGGLEDSVNFAGSPMSIQENLRREWD